MAQSTLSMGQIIKKLRKERNFTQEELAEQLNITPQAVSKWENETGMPDISQIVPIASVFGVSTDVLFGADNTTADEEALKIVQKAYALMEYGKSDTYLLAYNEIIAGLKNYPNNMILLNNCVGLGLSLCLPENGWIYIPEQAEKIASETARQANLIISYSKNITDIMRAHQVLVFLYSSRGDFEKALSEARFFPDRSDFTLYSNMSIVYEYMKDYTAEITCLCSDITDSLQALEDNAARLGKAYFNCGKYSDAIEVYETFFSIINAIFKDDSPPPYHDFDSGDCYILLAQAYLAIGESEKAMTCLENSVMYYINLAEKSNDEKIPWKSLMKSSFVKETNLCAYICKSVLKEKLLEKLSADEIKPLKENIRFQALYNKVKSLDN